MIWDIINHREVVQLEMGGDVRAVRLRRDRIVVVLDTSVHIFRYVFFFVLNFLLYKLAM